MPWLGPYPEAFVTYVAAKSSSKEGLGRVNDVSMCLDDADAVDKAYGSNLGFDYPYHPSSALRKALFSVNNYHNKTAGGQPVTKAETRSGTSRRQDSGPSQSSRTSSNKANRHRGQANSSSQNLDTQSGGGTQGNGRDDDDRNNDDNNNNRKDLNPPDPDISDDSSGTEDENPKAKIRKVRSKSNDPKSPSPKRRKTGGKSFKRTSQTRPADYRTPSAPPTSPLSARGQTRNTPSTSRIDELRDGPRQTPPNRSSRPDFLSPNTDSPTPPSSEDNDQENRRIVRHGQPPSRNAAGGRQPLANLPVPPARSGQATTTILQSLSSSPSPSTPESPIHPQTLHRHSPRSRDITDMGTAAPNIEPRDMRRASIRVMVTRDGSPVRVPRPQDANPDLITRSAQPPWRDPPIGDRPGRYVPIYESPTAAAANVNASVIANAPSMPALNAVATAVVPTGVTLLSNPNPNPLLNLADGVEGLEEKGMQEAGL
ncbi:MAG: hypothetical protein Q9192_006355 [Flavoplaca navasiana]